MPLGGRSRAGRAIRRVGRLLERPADPPEGVSLFSEANRRRFEHWVWTPPGARRPLPLVLVLHGAVDATGFVLWQDGRVKETAARLVRRKVVPPFALVLGCDTGVERGSGYCDWVDGTTRAETYVLDELLGWADATLDLNGQRHVMGISMGGYGALTMALRRPGTFASVSALSGYFDPMTLFNAGLMSDHSPRMWADSAVRDAHDPRLLIADEGRRAGLRVAFECGLDDPFIDESRRFHALLGELGVPHGYGERPGDHDWPYWRPRFADHLRFHLNGEGPLAF